MRKDVFPELETGQIMVDSFFTRDTDPPSHLVFTDLDGTLLDHHTYRWKEAVPALALCRERGIPVILASSKTRAELDVLRRELGLSAPFIAENGGGIFFPREIFKDAPTGSIPSEMEGQRGPIGFWQWSLGTPRAHLIRAFSHMRKSLGWSMKGFFEMDVAEISRLTGLSETSARLAAMREYDEPFVFQGETPEDLGPLYEAAAGRGLTVVSGGRFHHLTGNNHKGGAMARLASWYDGRYPSEGPHHHIPTIALGDSPNDFSMLERADFPVLVRSERNFPEFEKKIPGLKKTSHRGPEGWNAAVLNILSNRKEKVDA